MGPAATLSFIASLSTIAALAETANFDNLELSKPLANWTATQTGKGEAKWAVVADESAPSKPNVLKQSGEATFPVCIKDHSRIKGSSASRCRALLRWAMRHLATN